jgi:hypothetical protein
VIHTFILCCGAVAAYGYQSYGRDLYTIATLLAVVCASPGQSTPRGSELVRTDLELVPAVVEDIIAFVNDLSVFAPVLMCIILAFSPSFPMVCTQHFGRSEDLQGGGGILRGDNFKEVARRLGDFFVLSGL